MTNVTCGLTAKKPGSAPYRTLVIEYGTTLVLGSVALVAQRPIVIKLSRGRSVGRSVRASVCLSSALQKNGGSDPDAVWHHRSDGSKNEAGSAVWGSVDGEWYFHR